MWGGVHINSCLASLSGSLNYTVKIADYLQQMLKHPEQHKLL